MRTTRPRRIVAMLGSADNSVYFSARELEFIPFVVVAVNLVRSRLDDKSTREVWDAQRTSLSRCIIAHRSDRASIPTPAKVQSTRTSSTAVHNLEQHARTHRQIRPQRGRATRRNFACRRKYESCMRTRSLKPAPVVVGDVGVLGVPPTRNVFATFDALSSRLARAAEFDRQPTLRALVHTMQIQIQIQNPNPKIFIPPPNFSNCRFDLRLWCGAGPTGTSQRRVLAIPYRKPGH
ncbi:hypothetical protein EXIGLDRAFT_36191 [Exidia glandulosa HHB12029]|uniref:Uncharacterized protein n=1 Tax=Exidia glandulosa HHB12029 TaxID=1314781 RepID=A0A166MUC1_EXIGL|nr:hypothetical protein EXIGLDRAFT_36191 [Exidia glandulosa HHB12029]